MGKGEVKEFYLRAEIPVRFEEIRRLCPTIPPFPANYPIRSIRLGFFEAPPILDKPHAKHKNKRRQRSEGEKDTWCIVDASKLTPTTYLSGLFERVRGWCERMQGGYVNTLRSGFSEKAGTASSPALAVGKYGFSRYREGAVWPCKRRKAAIGLSQLGWYRGSGSEFPWNGVSAISSPANFRLHGGIHIPSPVR